jgi:uncharacterized protein YfeS
MNDDHDPWNDPTVRHPRAQALMHASLWDCVNELAPFGSDEGADAYVEYRSWRDEHPGENLTACIAWIGDESNYPDAFTFDATIIATVLGQLIDEGRIEPSVKPAARAAIARQLEEADDEERRVLLNHALRAVESG